MELIVQKEQGSPLPFFQQAWHSPAALSRPHLVSHPQPAAREVGTGSEYLLVYVQKHSKKTADAITKSLLYNLVRWSRGAIYKNQPSYVYGACSYIHISNKKTF